MVITNYAEVERQARELLSHLGLTIDEATVGIGPQGWVLHLYPPAHDYAGVIPTTWNEQPLTVKRTLSPL